ncbi:MAG: hypothetical protein HY080_17600 [Gammaproteobacteria bacterium]|nr:hypothetical protein [Gammaproteobacteria bacterium]
MSVADPGVTGGTVSYRWKTTDGSIVNSNASTTDWTLPNGPGIHYAYVLVANGYGGYTERRIGVNTDTFGLTTVVPPDANYAAPAGGVQTGNYYSSYVDGDSILEKTYDENEFRTYMPDVQVYLLNNVTNTTFPAAGAAAPVKTNARGQFVIPGVSPQAADPAYTFGVYTLRCSGGGVPWGDCNAITEMPDIAVNESRSTGRVAGATINGRFRLADKSACGTVNEFFAVEVTATATLLNRSGAPLPNRVPIRLSYEGDYTFLQDAAAAFVDIACEANATVRIPVGQNDATQNKFLGIATLAGVRAPIISAMSATLSTVAVGQFSPPPTGLPSDWVPSKEKFLAYRGLDSRKGACEYYKSIGAVSSCDANGHFSGAISFNDWKRTVRMAPYAVAGTTEYQATYVNQVDLNLTRNHHSISYGPGDTAGYVCNHLGPKDTTQPEINTAIDNAVNGKDLVACVAMDHRVSPGVNGNQPYTRFLVFGPDGSLLPSINLDGRSEKFVPGTCVVCHGGDKYTGKFPEDGSGFANIGAHFLPYDIGNFAFSCKPGLTRADQEEALYHLNQNVLNSGPTLAAQDLITGWYAAGSHTMNVDYLPDSWQEANLPVVNQGKGMAKVYQTLISHSCRTCHVNLPEKYNFDHFLNTVDFLNSTVCGTTSDQWRGYSMPNSLVTFNRFWQSPEQVAAYTTLKEACELRKHAYLGNGDLAAGDSHTVNTNIDGTLWARGNNASGQLGDGSTTHRATPVQVGSDANWLRVGAGKNHTLAIKNDGTFNDGTLWAWGDNTYGQLGIGTKSPTPNLVPVKVGTDSDWRDVVAGERHTIALKSNGTLWAWGSNEFGQLGIGPVAESLAPALIGTLADTDWISIAAGSFHTLAVKGYPFNTPSTATLRAWGKNDLGQLGDGTFNNRNLPVQIGSDTHWLFVAAGSNHSLAINIINLPIYISTLWGWGDNAVGQLGDGTSNSYNQPTQIDSYTGWQSIAAAGNHSIGSGPGLLGWGDNSFGQLGDNTTTNRSSPTPISSNNSWNWYPQIAVNRPAIGIGTNHTVMWDTYGYLWSWGSNAAGQLGDGTTTPHLVPSRSLMAPIITAIPPETTIPTGSNFQFNFSVLNINAQPSLKFSTVSIPAWLTFNPNSGLQNTAILSGTSPSTPGSNTVTLSVDDGILTTNYTFTFTVQ